MHPHEIDDAADEACREHVRQLVGTLLRNHNPFNAAAENDKALDRFVVGLKHVIGLHKTIEDTISRVVMERE